MLFKNLIIRLKKNQFFSQITKFAFYLFVRLLFVTYRIKVICDKDIAIPIMKQKGIFYFWHQNIIAGMLFFFRMRSQGYCVVSPSNDGKYAGYLCEKLGFTVLYGSANKNPIQLLRQALGALQKKGQLCIVGDGSRGPAFQLQQGVKYMAAKTSVPLIFVDCDIKWALVFKKSWDQFKLPLPFTKIIVHVRNQGFPVIENQK